MNKGDGLIGAVNDANNPVNEALEAKVGIDNETSATTGDLGKKPTQGDPNIEQKETQCNKQKADDGIGGGGPATRFASTAITGLDAEASAVSLTNTTRGEVATNHDEDHPIGPAWVATSSTSGGEHFANG